MVTPQVPKPEELQVDFRLESDFQIILKQSCLFKSRRSLLGPYALR